MSIIEEALRRLQGEGAGPGRAPAVGPAATSEGGSAPASTTAQAHSWSAAVPPASLPAPTAPPPALLSVTAVVLTLSAALGGAALLWLVRQARAGRAPASVATSPSARLATRSHSPAQAAERAGPASPVLSGIVVGEGTAYAVIDGEIYVEGDQVGDATLIDVAETSVQLRRPDGTEVSLLLPR